MEVGVGVGEGQEVVSFGAGMYVPLSEEDGEHFGGMEGEVLERDGDGDLLLLLCVSSQSRSQEVGTLPARRSVALRKEA